MRIKPIDRIVAELRDLLQDGAFEISLIGHDTRHKWYAGCIARYVAVNHGPRAVIDRDDAPIVLHHGDPISRGIHELIEC